MLEWYDFTIYAAFAVPISKNFFPADSEVVSLLLGFVTFGLGFVARPFGAAFLGGYADRRGRRDALSLTILLMAFGTGIIALCPGYDKIGIAAPIIILLARLIQGFSAGGEIGGAVSTLVEHAPPSRRGLYASFQQMSQGGSTMLSGLVAVTIALALTREAIAEWGWRLAFVVGLLIAPVGLYIRRELEDAPLFKASSHGKEMPIRVVLRDHWRAVVTGMLVVMLGRGPISQIIPDFAVRELKVSLSQSISVAGGRQCAAVLSLVGMLADRYRQARHDGRRARPVRVAYPAFLSDGHLTRTSGGHADRVAAFCDLRRGIRGSGRTVSSPVRATGISLTYSLGWRRSSAVLRSCDDQLDRAAGVGGVLSDGRGADQLVTVLTLRDRTGGAVVTSRAGADPMRRAARQLSYRA